MSESQPSFSRVIPIAEQRYGAALPRIPEKFATGRIPSLLIDPRKRRLHDLRISVTDRCNFRCTYCMPKSVFDKDYQFLPQSSLLSFEEMTRIARIFVACGVEKLRLTGGEFATQKHRKARRNVSAIAHAERYSCRSHAHHECFDFAQESGCTASSRSQAYYRQPRQS